MEQLVFVNPNVAFTVDLAERIEVQLLRMEVNGGDVSIRVDSRLPDFTETDRSKRYPPRAYLSDQ